MNSPLFGTAIFQVLFYWDLGFFKGNFVDCGGVEYQGFQGRVWISGFLHLLGLGIFYTY